MATLGDDTYVDLYELWQAAEGVLRGIGLPDMLGGPNLPPEVNRLIAATSQVRRDRPQRPEGWVEPTPAPEADPF